MCCPKIRYSLSKQDIKNGQGNARDAELGPLLPREPGLTLILRPHGGQEALQHMLDVTSKEHPTLRVKKLSQKYITVVHDVLKSFRACHLNNNRRCDDAAPLMIILVNEPQERCPSTFRGIRRCGVIRVVAYVLTRVVCMRVCVQVW